MAKWRELFKPWILEWGQEYFDYGQVVEIVEDGYFVWAVVSGPQTYRVEIQRSREHVTRMSCNCPYAAGGENCKHMAAVLLELEARSVDCRKDKRTDWQTALVQLSE